ncbi:MAG TPA: GGDEF domain-containing protein [Methylophilus sp.]|nr:GGDEF domain-containing protein [Methylophilus sp.]HQQ32530.1 GGDEF domain-containing protein [Methylophilus sp.]
MTNQASNIIASLQPKTEALAIDQSKYGFLYISLWLGSIVAACLSVIRLQHSITIGLADLLFAVIALVMAYYLRRNPQRAESIGSVTIVLYWALFLTIFIFAPYNKTRFLLFFLLAAAALFLKGRKIGMRWVVGIMLSVVAAHTLMQDSGYSNLDIITGVVHTLVLLVIMEFYEKLIRQQHTQLERSNLKLEEEVRQRTLELQEANRTLELEKEHLRHLTFHDHLTGLFNRQKIEEAFEYEKSQFDRYREPFSLVLIDVDHFKKINDHLGHESGDDTLKEIADILGRYTRVSDAAARWGGDEFIIIATKTDSQKVGVLAESIRSHIESAQLRAHDDNIVTVCIGTATITPDDNLKTILRRADNALYEAKRSGRNCIKSL